MAETHGVLLIVHGAYRREGWFHRGELPTVGEVITVQNGEGAERKAKVTEVTGDEAFPILATEIEPES